MYPQSGVCCSDFHVIDAVTGIDRASYPRTGSGPEYQLEAAIRLPYAPFRVLAGQSDEGNNVHPSFVELVSDADRPADVAVSGIDIGTVRAIASPFARPL